MQEREEKKREEKKRKGVVVQRWMKRVLAKRHA
jgi:hypothetical protein